MWEQQKANALQSAYAAVEASVRDLQQKPERDEDDVFGELVAKLMKKVPEELKDDLRIEVLQKIKCAKIINSD